MHTSLAIIGSGNMGGAFATGLQDLFKDQELILVDKTEDKLAAYPSFHTETDINIALNNAQVILIAVKPQSFRDLADQVTVDLRDKCIISIMAGVPIHEIQKMTNAMRVIRAMPNLGVKVKSGVIGWVASDECSQNDTTFAESIFSEVGTSIQLKGESYLDSITPLSGSGPAFYYLLTEYIQHKALQWGLSERQAQELARDTFIGSALYIQAEGLSPTEAREAVTSKGGVTEAALNALKNDNFEEIFSKALDEAIKRNAELGS